MTTLASFRIVTFIIMLDFETHCFFVIVITSGCLVLRVQSLFELFGAIIFTISCTLVSFSAIRTASSAYCRLFTQCQPSDISVVFPMDLIINSLYKWNRSGDSTQPYLAHSLVNLKVISYL